ncbi:hypothetical protein GGF32_001488 [Allomyces javanicus]|nr:hypothetical protein GGF32_001488 [Allomyces javanicus]
MKHIDRSALYTDLLARFSYVAEFVDFGDADKAAIKGAASALAPLVPTVVNAVYEKLFSFDITKRHFIKKMEGYEGDLEEDLASLSGDSDQIKFRKEMLSRYLVKLVTSEFDEAFVKYIDWVAVIHTNNKGKRSGINVEIIHINALMGFVENILISTIMDLPIDNDGKKAALLAFNKLLWIQNDLFVQYYAYDGSEIAEARANVKGVIRPAGTSGGCPFSGAKSS